MTDAPNRPQIISKQHRSHGILIIQIYSAQIYESVFYVLPVCSIEAFSLKNCGGVVQNSTILMFVKMPPNSSIGVQKQWVWWYC